MAAKRKNSKTNTTKNKHHSILKLNQKIEQIKNEAKPLARQIFELAMDDQNPIVALYSLRIAHEYARLFVEHLKTGGWVDEQIKIKLEKQAAEEKPHFSMRRSTEGVGNDNPPDCKSPDCPVHGLEARRNRN